MSSRQCGYLMALALLALSGCGNETKSGGATMANTAGSSGPQWQALTKKRVLFGHQSVGDNILSGIERLAAQDDVGIAIREQRTAPAAGGIGHFRIGRNGDPISKIRDFAAAIDAGAADSADVAMMKLCYADIHAGSDARQLADRYIESLDALAQRHPQTTFVAVTVPLMAVQTGPKAWLKRLLGKSPYGGKDNIRRAEFNAALRERYLGSGRLFDLARAESEFAGKPCTTRIGGQTAEALCPELTDDGGHLNARGKTLAATALLDVLNSVFIEAPRQASGPGPRPAEADPERPGRPVSRVLNTVSINVLAPAAGFSFEDDHEPDRSRPTRP